MFRYSYLLLLLLFFPIIACDKNEDNIFLSDTLPGTSIIDIAIDREDVAWFLTTEIDKEAMEREPWRCSLPVKYILSKYEGKSQFKIINPDNEPLQKIIFNHENTLWALSYNRIMKHDGNLFIIIQEYQDEDLYFQFIAVDGSNTIWAGGMNTGLVRIKENTITRLTSSNSGLPANSLNALYIDHQGNIWIALNNKNGIAKLTGTNFMHYNADNSNLTPQNILALTSTANGTIWAGTGNDDPGITLMKFNGTEWETANPVDKNGNRITGTIRHMITDRKDNIWAVTYNSSDYSHQLIKYNTTNWMIVDVIPQEAHISDLETDSQNRLWVATYDHGYFILDEIANN